MSKEVRGTIYVLIAGIAWGLSGTCGQYLMSQGMAPLVLTNVRILIAGLVLSLMAYGASREQLMMVSKNPKILGQIFIFALIGLILNQFAYLKAIHETNAGTATVLQYVCPVLVLAYSCLKDRVAPTLLEVGAISLAMVGTLLIATHGDLTALAVTPSGLFWGLFSAVTYAVYIILPVQLIRQYGSLIVIGLGMMMGGVLLAPLSGLLTLSWTFSFPVLGALVGIIGVGTIFSYTVFLKGTTLIGPVKSSLLASIEPVSAVFFAFWLMQEHFYALDLVGMFLILLAVVLISIKDLMKKKGNVGHCTQKLGHKKNTL